MSNRSDRLPDVRIVAQSIDERGAGGRDALLRRIADVLAVPVEAFLSPTRGAASRSTQTSALLSAFATIQDTATRDRCLDFVRACVEEAGQGVGPVPGRGGGGSCVRAAQDRSGARPERQRRIIRSRRRKAVLMPSFLWRRTRRAHPSGV